MSAFNVDDFVSATVEANDTEYPVGPAGDYMAVIDQIKTYDNRTNKDGEPIYPLDIFWDIQDEGFKRALDRDKAVVVQTIFLDLVDNNGRLVLDTSKGKNVPLGKLRDALGQNVPGWNPGRLVGAGPALVKVTVDVGNDGVSRNRIKGVGKVS